MSQSGNTPDGAKIIVWGMHRSGTSLLCTLLAHSGVWFGEQDQLIPPNEENPKGFWEHLGIRQINDRLLFASLSDWDYVSNFSFDSIPAQTVIELRLQAEAILKQLDGHPLAAIKEPRICLLYEFWRPLLNNDVHIFVSRHPAEIARSLNLRNDIPYEVGLALCEFYLVHALNALGDQQCLFLDHQEMLHQPGQSLHRVEQYLQDTHAYSGLTIDAEKLSTLVDMRYYRAKRQQHEQDTLPDALQQLWDSLQQDLPQAPSPHAMVRTVSPHAIKILEDHDRLAGFKAHITSKRLSHTNTALDNGLRKITDLYQSNKTVIEQLHSIRLEQQAKIAQLTSKMNQLEAQRLQQQSRIEQLTAKMSELAAAGERLQKTARQELKKTRAIADQAIVILASIDRQLADPVNRPYRMALSIADRLTRLAGRKPTDLINQRIGKLQGDIRELRARQWQLQAGEHGEVD